MALIYKVTFTSLLQTGLAISNLEIQSRLDFELGLFFTYQVHKCLVRSLQWLNACVIKGSFVPRLLTACFNVNLFDNMMYCCIGESCSFLSKRDLFGIKASYKDNCSAFWLAYQDACCRLGTDGEVRLRFSCFRFTSYSQFSSNIKWVWG